MNLTQLDIILSDDKKRNDLLALMKRRIEINLAIAEHQKHIDAYDDDIDDINKEAKTLGLKATEFKQIVNDYVNEEATLNHMAYLEKLESLKAQ